MNEEVTFVGRGVTRLSNGFVMCSICFEYNPPDLLWTDEQGQTWDVCRACHDAEHS